MFTGNISFVSQGLRGVADSPIRVFLLKRKRSIDRASEWNHVAEKSHKIEDGAFELPESKYGVVGC